MNLDVQLRRYFKVWRDVAWFLSYANVKMLPNVNGSLSIKLHVTFLRMSYQQKHCQPELRGTEMEHIKVEGNS